jgi:hypothetical protein
MKEFSLLLAVFLLISVMSCTEDETIEEQVFKQEMLNPNNSASGEEGYDGTDDEKDL